MGNIENKNVAIVCQTIHEQIIEKAEDNTHTVVINDENNVNNESDWQRPISLKGFKKKLNDIFVVKWVEWHLINSTKL